MRRTDGGITCRVASLVAVALLLAAGSEGRAKQPPLRNVVIILMDDQGADLSLLKTPGIATPNLDRFAASGAYFRQAYASCSSCSPSRASILTGMWPHSNRHWRNTQTPDLGDPDIEFTPEGRKLDRVRIDDSIPTLVELLKDKGFFTAITHKLHLSPPWKYPFEARRTVRHDPEEFRRVIPEMIEAAGDRPFFFLANVEPPHRSFRNTPMFRRMLKQGLTSPDPAAIAVPDYLPDVPGVRQDLQEYFASVQVADACAGAILEALAASGRGGETLVFYTSDNGMPVFRSKASGYPAGTHVPLAAAGPGVLPDRVTAQPVSLLDIMPTTLDALGLPVPPTVQGASLWPWLTGQGELPARPFVFTEHNSHGPDPREAYPQRVACDGKFYYILNLDPSKKQLLSDDLLGEGAWRNPGYPAVVAAREQFPDKVRFLDDMTEGRRPPEEFYDLEKDRWGTVNLADDPAHRETLETMRAAVQEWRDQTNDIKKKVSEF
jgi:N-sulfoglucosamine sulfohydrolase